MVLSNYKCMHIRIQISRILLQTYKVSFQVHSSNRLPILLILQLEITITSPVYSFQKSPTQSRGITQSSQTSRNFILHAEDKELFD